MKVAGSLLLVCAACTLGGPATFTQSKKTAGPAGLPAGAPKLWEDRGDLTPAKVYWAYASTTPDPLARLPAPPFSHFEKDVTPNARSPKFKCADSKGVKWTAKMGPEAHSDAVTPRLAWALGFGTVEGYYVESGKVEGVTASTDLGEAKGFLKPDGTFEGGARFKRHDKEADEVKDAKGQDITWDESQNPGVPMEQLSGLMLFDALVNNWDAQSKNMKVLHQNRSGSPENWFVESDLGGDFADKPYNKFDLTLYRKEPTWIKGVSKGVVELNYVASLKSVQKLHERIPLAHAQWFRKQLEKLTDDEIQAAFDAAFATDGLNRAYATGDAAKIKEAREHDLGSSTRETIAGFVATVRARIEEFKTKVPAGA